MNKKRLICFSVIICFGLLFSFWAVRGNKADEVGTVTYTPYSGAITLLTDSNGKSVSVVPTECYLDSNGVYHINCSRSVDVQVDSGFNLADSRWMKTSSRGSAFQDSSLLTPLGSGTGFNPIKQFQKYDTIEELKSSILNSLAALEPSAVNNQKMKISSGFVSSGSAEGGAGFEILNPVPSEVRDVYFYNTGAQFEFSGSVERSVVSEAINDDVNGVYSGATYQQYIAFNFGDTVAADFLSGATYKSSTMTTPSLFTSDNYSNGVFNFPQSTATSYDFSYTDKYGRVSTRTISVAKQNTTQPSATYTAESYIVAQGKNYYVAAETLKKEWDSSSKYATLATLSELPDDIESGEAQVFAYDASTGAWTGSDMFFFTNNNGKHYLVTKTSESADGLTLTDGAKYQVNYTLKDTGDNLTRYERFIYCDGKAPEITDVKINDVSIKSNTSTLYYNTDINCSISFKDSTACSWEIKAGSSIVPAESCTVSQDGDTTTIAFPYSDEFNGPISVTVTDLVGNKKTYASTTVVLDKTPLAVTNVEVNGAFDVFLNENHVINSNNCKFDVSFDANDVSLATIMVGGEVVSLEKKRGRYTGEITLEDGIYTAMITMKDSANNESVAETKSFIIDTEKPDVACSADGSTVHFLVKDSNIENMVNAQIQCSTLECEVSNFVVQIGDTQYEGSSDDIRELILDKTLWTLKEGSTTEYELDVTFLTDGNYILSGFAEDAGGNVSETVKTKFSYDKTEPVFVKASFSVPKNEFSDYGYIARKSIGLEITVYDAVSDIASVVVNYKDNSDKAHTGECVVKEDDESGNTYLFFFGEKNCLKGFVESITITDSHGNTSTTEFKNGIIIDKETDDVELLNLQISDDTNGKEVLNRDVALTLTVSDTYSGIASYEYSINGKKKSESGDLKKILYSKELTDTIVAAENEGDNIVVSLTATDNAGNTRTITKAYNFDVTKSTISVSYDETTDNNYYNKTRTATVSVKDAHFDSNGVTFTITNNDTDINKKATFTSSDNKTYVATVPLEEEGIYSFGLSVTDRAGNVQTYKDNTIFTIDKTAPKISFSYDENTAKNGKYFASARTVNVLVDELNFDEDLVDLSIDTTDGSVPKVSEFTDKNTNHLASLSFSVDGNYTLSGTVTDLAGNVSEEVSVDDFVIDTEAPEISFAGVVDGTSYNGDVEPAITVTDTNYDSSEITLNGAKYGTHDEHKLSTDASDSGEIFRYATFERVLGSDDAYTLTLIARDLAGNQTEDSISFKVNRFGSRYSLDANTQAAMEKYYVTSEKNFVIIEDNLDRVNNYELCYITNGATKVLEYEKDYTLQSSVGGSGWNTYVYDIKSDMLTSDGVYSFVVYSTDAAGNKSDNITKGTPLKVCLDNTAPVIAVNGLEDTGVYRQTDLSVQVDITDNIAYDKAVYILNGEEKDVTDTTFTIDIAENKKEQTLEVLAVDKAGNSVTTDVYTFLVDSSAGDNVTVKSRKEDAKSPIVPIVIGCGVGVLLISSSVGVVVLRRRRKKNND